MPRFKLARHVGPSVAASVSYDTTIGNGVDGSGFANLPLRAGAKRFFVNSSTGSDTNTSTQAQSASTPVATIAKAKTYVTQGAGDQVLVAEGTTYSEEFSSLTGKDGFSQVYPTVFQSYDPADALNEAKYGRATTNRPTFTRSGSHFMLFGSGTSPKYIAIRGLDFSPPNVSNNQFVMLLNTTGSPDYLLIENNIFRHIFIAADMASPDTPYRVLGWVIRGNSIYGGWRTVAQGHAQGIYLSGANYTIEENVFWRGGWSTSAVREDDVDLGGCGGATSEFEFRHNLYIQENTSGISRRNISIDGSLDGGSYRGDSIVQSNILIDNPIQIGALGGGASYDASRPTGVSFEAAYNVALGSATANTSSPGDGWGLSSSNGKPGCLAHHNIFAHAGTLNGRGSDITADFNQPSYANIEDNVFYQWVGGSSTHSVPGAEVWGGGNFPAQVFTSYNRNKWDDPASGTNVNVGSVSFSNTYTADQIYQALGFTGADAAARKQAFIDYVINHPEDRTIQRQFHSLALAGYGITAPSIDATPTLSSASGTATGTTTANLSFSTTGSNGIAYWIVTTSSTPPTAEQIIGKHDASGAVAAAADTMRVTASGSQSMAATGLTSATGYYLYVVHQPFNGTRSAVVSSSLFTTS